MTFSVTVTDIPQKQLGEFLAALHNIRPRGSHIHPPDWVPEHVALIEGPKKPRARAESRLMMTGKTPNQGTSLLTYLDYFERHEKRVGIGNVTVGSFVEYLTKLKLDEPNKAKTRLLHEGYVKYADG